MSQRQVPAVQIGAAARRTGLALLLAITVALLSVGVERRGPELAPYGNLCGPRHDQLCYEPQLKGGFPIAYLYDAPGTSVERNLGLEDKLAPWAFILNLAIYFAIGFGGLWFAAYRRAKRN